MSTNDINNSALAHSAPSKKSKIKKRAGIAAVGITLAHALVLGGAGLGLASCANNASNKNAEAPATEKLAVSASFYPIAWLTEQIGGDAVEVSSVTPTNAEPHDFELSPKDADSLSKSSLVLYVEGFQPSLDDAIATIDSINAVNLAEAVDLVKADPSVAEHEHHHHGSEAEHEEAEHAHDDSAHEDAHEHEHTEADHDGDAHAEEAEHEHSEADHDHDHGELGLDPHFWLDPERMESAAEKITHSLSTVSPEHKADFEKNLQTLTASLDKLDTDFTNGLKQCKLNTFVTSHSAFSYLAGRYGLTQASISGVDPEAEPSPADLAAVKEVVNETGTTTIFTEELVSPKVAEALANETGASTAVLSPLESQPESGDYLSAMAANLTALQQALQCE